ncbi:hypothetical protein BCR39DRAFT_549190 [Naematelia encephala]|uniref:Elongation factor 1-gamma n=1 Tax=Naematelia encephala TaxID=71784 RepID=A0A1Y2AMN8_9TREE|nr:hypothetical protein BCR39DRAFT_549190 [Naematelia encephala]
MAPKLIGSAGNPRVSRVLAAAALAGVELDFDSSFTMSSNWKTTEFLQKFPLGTLPVLEDGEFRLSESAAIAEYVASLGPNQTILPSDPKELALVHQWMSLADQEIFIKHAHANGLLIGRFPYSKPTFTAMYEGLLKTLTTVDGILAHKTFVVGERITLGDIILVTAVVKAFTGIVDAAARAKLPNLVRYVETVTKHPKLIAIFDNGNIQYTETQAVYQPPAKPKETKAPKEAKPKAEAAPKPPKAPKAPKEKEPEDDDDEPLVPEEPKAKNPLDDLPKSAFNLEEWKRQYSNLDTRKEALPWFYEKFDKEGFSIWRVDFKYNEELTLVFMSSNQIGGFFNRLEASRKYLFGSVGVLGKANDSIITGVLVCRGSDYKPVVDVAPDWESYEYKAIDLSNSADKDFFEAAMAWDLVIDGREWADGKNFK